MSDSRGCPSRAGAHDITCQQAVALVTDYLDGALSGDDRDRFEAHLAECDNCREHFAQIQVTVAVTGRVRDEDLDPLARQDLMDLYRRWRHDPQREVPASPEEPPSGEEPPP